MGNDPSVCGRERHNEGSGKTGMSGEKTSVKHEIRAAQISATVGEGGMNEGPQKHRLENGMSCVATFYRTNYGTPERPQKQGLGQHERRTKECSAGRNEGRHH